MIVSHHAFMLFATFAALIVCVVWGARDVYLLFKYLPKSGRAKWQDQGAWRDQIFGSVTGLVLIALGLYGTYRFWFTD